MRVVIAGIVGGIAMYVWASIAHLSPLAQIGIHTLPNESFVAGVVQNDLNKRDGVYIYPSPMGDSKANHAPSTTAGLLVYNSHSSGALEPKQLGIELALEVIESLLMAVIAAQVAGGFGGRVRVAALVGLIAGMATNFSYWNWWSFGLDYTLANAFIEAMKFVVAGLVIAAILRRKASAASV